MGFFGEAEAITFKGDVTVDPSIGLETLSGKSLEGVGGGTCAGGAGKGLVEGVQVMGTAGAKGRFGWGGGVVVLALPEPHPANTAVAATNENARTMREWIVRLRVTLRQPSAVPPAMSRPPIRCFANVETAALEEATAVHYHCATPLPLSAISGAGAIPCAP